MSRRASPGQVKSPNVLLPWSLLIVVLAVAGVITQNARERVDEEVKSRTNELGRSVAELREELSAKSGEVSRLSARIKELEKANSSYATSLTAYQQQDAFSTSSQTSQTDVGRAKPSQINYTPPTSEYSRPPAANDAGTRSLERRLDSIEKKIDRAQSAQRGSWLPPQEELQRKWVEVCGRESPPCSIVVFPDGFGGVTYMKHQSESPPMVLDPTHPTAAYWYNPGRR